MGPQWGALHLALEHNHLSKARDSWRRLASSLQLPGPFCPGKAGNLSFQQVSHMPVPVVLSLSPSPPLLGSYHFAECGRWNGVCVFLAYGLQLSASLSTVAAESILSGVIRRTHSSTHPHCNNHLFCSPLHDVGENRVPSLPFKCSLCSSSGSQHWLTRVGGNSVQLAVLRWCCARLERDPSCFAGILGLQAVSCQRASTPVYYIDTDCVCILPFSQGVQGSVHGISLFFYPYNNPMRYVRLRESIPQSPRKFHGRMGI